MTHTGLNGSALVGRLARLPQSAAPPSPPAFVDGLARWLGWADAIALAGAMQAPAAQHAPRAPQAVDAAAREFDRVRTALARRIHDRLADATEAAEPDYPPHRQRHLILQQAMEAAVGPLRTQVRATVAALSPALARLAAIDAVLHDALHEREQAVLARVPALLEAHFHHLQRTQPTPVAALAAFRAEQQALLLAELDQRLLPVQGLLDAARGHPTQAS